MAYPEVESNALTLYDMLDHPKHSLDVWAEDDDGVWYRIISAYRMVNGELGSSGCMYRGETTSRTPGGSIKWIYIQHWKVGKPSGVECHDNERQRDINGVLTWQTEKVGKQSYELLTLVAEAPKKEHPIEFTRAGECHE